jgi:DNA-binding MarR family transcriptional regulator
MDDETEQSSKIIVTSDTESVSKQLTEDFGDINPQLLIALTSRWRRKNGSLAMGISKRQLRNKTGLSLLDLETLLEEFGKKVRKIGLELVSYVTNNETWYCLRSIYVVPNELTGDEQAVLGTIIYLIEKKTDHRRREEQPINKTALVDRLVKRGYYSDYSLNKMLQTLEAAGYIQRSPGKIKYGPRTKIELTDERRKEIAERTEGVLL